MFKFTFILISLTTVLFSCTVTEKLSNNSLLKCTKTNSVGRSYKRMVIAGMGNSINRIFFENLYSELSADFAKAGITTEEKYLGKDSLEVIRNAKMLFKQNEPGAVLLVFPTSVAKVTDNMQEILIVHATSMKLEQHISFQLYDKEDASSSIWESTLDININFTKQGVYQDISKEIIKSLKNNRVISP